MLFSCKPGDTIFIADRVSHSVTRDKVVRIVREFELMEDGSTKEVERVIASSMGRTGWITIDSLPRVVRDNLVATTDGDRAFDLAGEF